MKTHGIFVSGVGTYLPDTLVKLTDAVEKGWCAPETAELGWVSARVAGDMPAVDLAVRAGKQALERSPGGPDDIDILLYGGAHHQGPDGWCPPQYVQRYTVGRDIFAVGLSNSCNAMMCALELAANFLRAQPERTGALLCTGDNFDTPLFDRWRAHEGGVFGDVGSALALSSTAGFAELLSVCSQSKPELEELSRGAEPIHPPSCTLGKPMDFEARFANYEGDLLELAAQLVPEVYGSVVRRTLTEAGVDNSQITRIVHQAAGSPVHLQLLFEPLGFDVEQGTLQFGQLNGRSGCSDHFAGFDHLVTTGQVGPGDHVLFIGGGPGMVASCAVVRINERAPWA
ncbi:MAG: hypothetical protein QOE03_597 [Micromonosporaceae bacterium]|jgi:3-oxoacyl-[acyl-carrier-protein] synthase III|nr:hypothetical protein [Micromonosporaceae bacterium]